ncbi:shikimate dehydrogenase [Natronospirillum operosum]|uniref:shikimate dehydrogenase (NADP(+)) n=1 Tax=Natronospirillum operosum TaxID=2759953 RepID=A0A4Z0WE07_9GAMM|nr:shikimate dehydrogenase [Natronospirillum operosum]TGG93396.1 shikimate dehydrogenase [Natronospirillum operosum]
MMKLALIGEGIAQSQSPDLHRRLGGKVGLEVQYDLVDALGQTDFHFASAVNGLRAAGYRGTNVTYPFKELACHLADQRSAGVDRVGTANTLLFDGGRVLADNTDYSGFISAYRHQLGNRPAGEVLLIGAGGVGRAIACALGELGVKRVHVMERDPVRSSLLCRDLQQMNIQADSVSAAAAKARLGDWQGIVNCTPVGHVNHPGCPIPTDDLQAHHWVFDAVYIPAQTRLLAAAEARGSTLLTGVELFIFQGVDAFRRFAADQVDASDIDVHVMSLFRHYYQQLVTVTSDQTTDS